MSTKSKTKYSKTWETDFDWLQPFKIDVFSAECSQCQKAFSVSGGGVSQVKSHANSKLYSLGRGRGYVELVSFVFY